MEQADYVTVSDYPDVPSRATDLGLAVPDEDTQLLLLPRGFDPEDHATDLAQESDASTLRKLLNEAGLDARELQPGGERLPTVIQKAADWVAPTVLLGAAMLSQNPTAVQLALGVLESYITDKFRELTGGRGTVSLAVVTRTTRSGKYRKVEYEGPPSELKSVLDRALREAQDE